MRTIAFMAIAVVFWVLWPVAAMAQSEKISATVTFRESIALPPGSVLDLRILDATDAGVAGAIVAAQRVAMSQVPLTAALTYDPGIADEGSSYRVTAVIRTADNEPLFLADEPLDGLDGSGPAAVDLVLEMITAPDDGTPVPQIITGVRWTVTEVFGEPWHSEEPATLMIDDEMSFSIFGGCNLSSGQLERSGHGLTFPEDQAATMKACPDETEALERRFLAALRQVSGFVRYGSGVVLTNLGGRAVLHFVRAPE